MGTERGPRWTDNDLGLIRRTSPSADRINDAASERGVEDEAKSRGSGLFGKAVGIMGVVAFFLSFVFDWGSWVLWGVVGIGVAAGVVKGLVGLVRRRRRKEEQELVLPKHGTELGRKGRGEVSQASATTASQGPVSGLRRNTLPKKI